ncbi:DUF305 domain-containing protein [Streptomyces sp. AK02-01A]|uniref:DUF305 domain-containing protein n=1 Tax=Streptomyces sp. AK02-01A TaxID=3028648 RepID=UPI0029A94212|nr:DUF305 domain-containing protein [Streptomyces sp. AK02-01A]MDX3849547.1 DUF305 domain-containing protein [Streptomyces sp. AK02-01A]MDX3849883.1 DUF305 domain-containing protein [Streptomyces sp. AK02-01A]
MTRTQWAAITAVVLALLFAGTATVVGAGRDDGPAAPRDPAADSVEAGFARDMAVHHQQAVEMSFIVRDSTDDEDVRRLAYDIANTQANQRGMLLGWLDMWGLPKVQADQEPMAWMRMPMDMDMGPGDGAGMDHGQAGHQAHDGSLMPGMATNTELERLRGARGKQAEILYLQLMTDHHKGGVSMAQGCARMCTVGTERNLAEGMVAAQQAELGLMADLLKERGAKPREG